MRSTIKLQKELGFYIPSFFHMHIATDNKLFVLDDLSKSDFSTFVHEYIHFIQDITTIYGLNNIHVMAEYMRDCVNRITQTPNSQFKTPILPNPDNENFVYLNKYIQTLTYGDSSVVFDVLDIISIDEFNDAFSEIPNTPPQLNTIKSICLKYESRGGTGFYTFGALCIMESMAYLIEQVSCQNYVESPSFPYNSAQLVVDKIYPRFGLDKLNIIALCDISLNLSNPGKIFLEILNDWKLRDTLPISPEVLYDEYYDKEMSINNSERVNWESIFISQSKNCKEQLFRYFNHEHFDPIKKWISHIFDISQKYRINNKYFILDIAKQNQIRTNRSFINLYKELGTPLMSNNNSEYYFYDPSINMAGKPPAEIGYFLAINQIFEVFQGKVSCELTSFCSQKLSNTTPDNRCSSKPWTRCNPDENLCPFTALWKHWGLINHIPTNKM